MPPLNKLLTEPTLPPPFSQQQCVVEKAKAGIGIRQRFHLACALFIGGFRSGHDGITRGVPRYVFAIAGALTMSSGLVACHAGPTPRVEVFQLAYLESGPWEPGEPLTMRQFILMPDGATQAALLVDQTVRAVWSCTVPVDIQNTLQSEDPFALHDSYIPPEPPGLIEEGHPVTATFFYTRNTQHKVIDARPDDANLPAMLAQLVKTARACAMPSRTLRPDGRMLRALPLGAQQSALYRDRMRAKTPVASYPEIVRATLDNPLMLHPLASGDTDITISEGKNILMRGGDVLLLQVFKAGDD